MFVTARLHDFMVNEQHREMILLQCDKKEHKIETKNAFVVSNRMTLQIIKKVMSEINLAMNLSLTFQNR